MDINEIKARLIGNRDVQSPAESALFYLCAAMCDHISALEATNRELHKRTMELVRFGGTPK